MIKILIADDEAPIREWIRFCIQKHGLNHEIVGLASNGQQALEIFDKYKPDLVFADIKMPVMDGLELIKCVHSKSPETRIVMLTGYRDFEYARQALKSGAMEYMLKTEVDQACIDEILRKTEESLSKHNSKPNRNTYKLQIQQQSFIHYMVNSHMHGREFNYEDLLRYNILLKEGMYFVLALKIPGGDYTGENEFVIPENEQIANLSGFTYDRDTFIIMANIVSLASLDACEKLCYDFAVSLCMGGKCTIGCGGIQNKLKHLPESISSAVSNVKMGFYRGYGSINFGLPIVCNEEDKKSIKAILAEVQECISIGDAQRASEVIRNLMNTINSMKYPDIDYIIKKAFAILDLYSKKFALQEGLAPVVIPTDIQEDNIQTFEELNNFVQRYLEAIEESSMKDKNTYSISVVRAIRYVNQNYKNQIGIPDVAAHVNLNPDYFSRIFKNETGINFSSYLAKVRLERSIELLENTNFKVHEIAEEVGYNNISYFSTIFKKKYGINPFDYRNKGHANTKKGD